MYKSLSSGKPDNVIVWETLQLGVVNLYQTSGFKVNGDSILDPDNEFVIALAFTLITVAFAHRSLLGVTLKLIVVVFEQLDAVVAVIV